MTKEEVLRMNQKELVNFIRKMENREVSIDCTDCSSCTSCNYCTDCTSCTHCTVCSYCTNCTYCTNCKSCNDCIGCTGLRNKSYCVKNIQFTEEEYSVISETFEKGCYEE